MGLLGEYKTQRIAICIFLFLQSALSSSSSEIQSFSQNPQSEVELQEYKAMGEHWISLLGT